MYRLIRAELPQTIIISVGHRSTLQRHHQQHLRIDPDKSWQLLTH